MDSKNYFFMRQHVQSKLIVFLHYVCMLSNSGVQFLGKKLASQLKIQK